MSKRSVKSSLQTFGTKIREIQNNPSNTPGGFLSKTFLALLERCLAVSFSRIDEDANMLFKWNSLLTCFLEDPKNAVPQNQVALQAAKGNLYKELFKGEMSWKVFIKACRVLQATKIEFNFKLHLASGKQIDYTTNMNLGPAYTGQDAPVPEPISPEVLK